MVDFDTPPLHIKRQFISSSALYSWWGCCFTDWAHFWGFMLVKLYSNAERIWNVLTKRPMLFAFESKMCLKKWTYKVRLCDLISLFAHLFFSYCIFLISVPCQNIFLIYSFPSWIVSLLKEFPPSNSIWGIFMRILQCTDPSMKQTAKNVTFALKNPLKPKNLKKS